ncbi:MAG: type II secretion system F family protein [Bryobacteraceae bacterium]
MFLFALLIFLIVMVGTIVLYSLFGGSSSASEVQKVKDRLLGKTAKASKTDGGDMPALIKDDAEKENLVVKVLMRFQLADRVTHMIEQAGLRWTPAGLLQAAIGASLGAFLVVYLLFPSPINRLAWPAGILGFFSPFLYLLRLGRARLKKFEEQFPDSLEFVSRSMRAGHAFSVSLEMIHREFSEPLAGEFRRTFDEQNLGLPLEIALQNLAKRVPLLEVHFFVSAVLMQKRTGGNLAELLDRLAFIIRERFKLRGRIKAISAHGRITATTLSMIPFVVAFLMFYTNREYIEFFVKDETGNMMAGVALFFQAVGYLVMRKIVAIEI